MYSNFSILVKTNKLGSDLTGKTCAKLLKIYERILLYAATKSSFKSQLTILVMSDFKGCPTHAYTFSSFTVSNARAAH